MLTIYISCYIDHFVVYNKTSIPSRLFEQETFMYIDVDALLAALGLYEMIMWDHVNMLSNLIM